MTGVAHTSVKVHSETALIERPVGGKGGPEEEGHEKEEDDTDEG